MLKHFRAYFARASALTTGTSFSETSVASDFLNYIIHTVQNAPLFIAAFCQAYFAAQQDDPDISLPEVSVIKRRLAKHSVRFELRPPHLLFLDPHCRNVS